jgi:3-isopropylmalate dehydratase small subunit
MSENKILNVTVDLNKKKISVEDLHEEFMVDDNLLERIIFNLDDIDMTLKNKKIIKDFEENRMKNKPWIFINE